MIDQNQLVNELLMKKSGQALSFLAAELIKIPVGEKIPTFTELMKQEGFSRGTLQNAMTSLENIGSVSLAKRGHLGTFLVEKNMELLMSCVGIRYISGTMPMPYTKVYEGLATGLFNTLSSKTALSVDISYLRGSQKRINLVLDGRYEFAIMSRLSAQSAIAHGNEIEIIKDFGPGSYLTGQGIVFGSRQHTAIQNGMRVGVDVVSLDHVSLTEAAIKGLDVERVQLNYNQIMPMIESGKIDAAIWNMDNITERYPDAHVLPLPGGNHADETSAVMVVRKSGAVERTILQELVDVDEVLRQQRLVIEGKIFPNY